MAAPRLSDIAKRAGVSTAAVSIVLNNHETNRVGKARRRLILKIAGELGYAPNAVAKALFERRTRLLGLAVPLRDPIFFNQFIAQALSGIQSTLMQRGYNLLIFSPSGKPGRETRDQILESRFTDGIIFINTRFCTVKNVNETIRELNAAEIKFTMINSYYGLQPINYVGVDDTLIGATAAEYLVGKGHRKIAFLSGSAKLPTHIHLLQGLRRKLKGYDLSLPAEMIGCSQYNSERAFEILDRWFSNKKNRPSAIFCADDQLLLYLYDYAEAGNLSIPADVSVLARRNAGPSHYLRPRPTSLVIPTFQIGQLAANMLIDSIEKPAFIPKRVLLPAKLVPGSTA